MPDQIPKNSTESLIAWLTGDHGGRWLAEARDLWEQQAGQPKRVENVKRELATFLETSLLNAAPEHGGDVYGHLLADALAGVDWEAAAGSLLNRVVARVAA